MSDDIPDSAGVARDLRQVWIEIASLFDAVVKIGGVDVARALTGFSLTHRVGEIPRIVVEVAPRSVHLSSEVALEVLKTIPELAPAVPRRITHEDLWVDLFLAVADWVDAPDSLDTAKGPIFDAYKALFQSEEGHAIYSEAVDSSGLPPDAEGA